MQISNSFSSPLTSGVSNNPNGPIKNSVHSAEPVSQVTPEQSSNKQTKPIIALDEQTMALVKQKQAVLSAQSPLDNEDFAVDNTFASQDRPLTKNEIAVANYHAIDNLAQRESVQQLFGVDVFA